MTFDPLSNPYPSKRMVIYGRNGMVATSQPQAAQVGLDILKKGGNAIDAAVATAAALTVLEPAFNGIGGDSFAIIWYQGKMYGMNSSGPAPMAVSMEVLKKEGFTSIPRYGWVPATVPGVPWAWANLSKRFGNKSLLENLDGAIRYSEEGYPVSPVISKAWDRAFRIYKENLPYGDFSNWCKVFAPKASPPKAGEVWKSPFHGKTLLRIGETEGKDFYIGEIADLIDRYSRENGGFLRKEDLESFAGEWVDPISVDYKGVTVWELPPNSQGLIVLMALNILKGFNFEKRECIESYHTQIEAMKVAFMDGQNHITDINYMKGNIQDFLSQGYGEDRRRIIGNNAIVTLPKRYVGSSTVYLATADGQGNMVSYIQSNYTGFGSGIVVPGTGISLTNRLLNFSLNPEEANCLEPGKRTYNTIIPGFLTKKDIPLGPFGVMGGFMQPQGHVQVVSNLFDFNYNPQASLDAPRWQWIEGNIVSLESEVTEEIAEGLRGIGHNVRRPIETDFFGRGQIILKNDEGVMVGGTEPRTDSSIAVW